MMKLESRTTGILPNKPETLVRKAKNQHSLLLPGRQLGLDSLRKLKKRGGGPLDWGL